MCLYYLVLQNMIKLLINHTHKLFTIYIKVKNIYLAFKEVIIMSDQNNFILKSLIFFRIVANNTNINQLSLKNIVWT